jgi:hypothetical protein
MHWCHVLINVVLGSTGVGDVLSFGVGRALEAARTNSAMSPPPSDMLLGCRCF